MTKIFYARRWFGSLRPRYILLTSLIIGTLAASLMLIRQVSAAVLVEVVGGTLFVTGDAADDLIVVNCTGGQVKVNGIDPDSGPYLCASLSGIDIDAGSGWDNIDLTQVGPGAFSMLNSVIVDGGKDNDTINGSSLADTLLGGFGDDTLSGGAGSDYLDGGEGGDFYVILGEIATADIITINDSGIAGLDLVSASGTSGDDAISITDTSIVLNSLIVNYGPNLESLILDAANGNDIISFQCDGIPTSVLGGEGNDLFIVDGTEATLLLDGQNGGDSYTINFGMLNDPVSLSDSGIIGPDLVAVNGTPNADILSITDTSITNGLETINYGSGLENLTLDAAEGDDIISFRCNGIPTTVLGGIGDDSFIVEGTEALLNLDGQDGGDSYLIDFAFGNLLTPVAVDDSGIIGPDLIEVVSITGNQGANDGQMAANLYNITASQVSLGTDVVSYDGAIESLTVKGTPDDDTFQVTSSPNTNLTLDGQNQASGDTLSFNAEGLPVSTGPGWIAVIGRQRVYYNSIEQLDIINGVFQLFLPAVLK